MNKTIKKIIDLIAELFFPQDPIELQVAEVVSNIAKIQCDEGDRITVYPHPAYSFFAYRHPTIRSMIWRLKYRGDKSVATLFAKRIHDQLCEELAELAEWKDFKKPLLIAIPVTKRKLRIRGFNQSAAICKALADIDEGRFFHYIPNVLYKIKDTKSQARVKDKLSRLQNLKDSFVVKDISGNRNNGSGKNVLLDQNVILLDDVLTTGSTLTEASRILRNSGARNIIWVVVAH